MEEILAASKDKVVLDGAAAGRALPYLNLPGFGAPVAPKALEKK